jgi:hypothetical protein
VRQVTKRHEVGSAGAPVAKGRIDRHASGADRSPQRAADVDRAAPGGPLAPAQVCAEALRQLCHQGFTLLNIEWGHLIKGHIQQCADTGEFPAALLAIFTYPPLCSQLRRPGLRWLLSVRLPLAERGRCPRSPCPAALAFIGRVRPLAEAAFASGHSEKAVEYGVKRGPVGFIFHQGCGQPFAESLRLHASHADHVHGIERFG